MIGGPETTAARERLTRGQIDVKGRMPRASNATFLVELRHADMTLLAVYKPERGERPLWDFPPGLYRREMAAWELSEALGWGLVPPTVIRDGPFGEGSFQLFVSADFRQHYFTLLEDARHHDALQRICVFDLIANNTDRKSGHCLLGPDGRVYAVDNGLTFHVDDKLRTVIWDFAGQLIPASLREDVRRLVERGVPSTLADLLDREERTALVARAEAVLARRRFPADRSGRRYPWPLV
jgi:uncharacterized repeat protein (TIGR03843 family)